jgi:predicted phage terminase large subunit-like protein
MKSLFDYYVEKRPRNYETSWHLRWICEVLQRGLLERKNVILECPPRHSKSELANQYAPAWYLEEVGFDQHFGLVCNSDNLGQKFSRACKQLVKMPLSVDRDSQWKVAADAESLDYSYRATGIRGQITGWGFDTLILDDNLKSGLEAKSDAVRTTVNENIISAGLNRLSPTGIIVAMQARLHQQDPIGYLLDMEQMKFLRLHLPATNDSGTEAWLHDGYSGERTHFPAYGALWPTRYPREKLDLIRSTVTPYYWSAQYAQVPSMGELTYFDVSRCPKYERYGTIQDHWIGVDCANTETKSGSFTAFVCLAHCGDHMKVLSAHRGRWRQDRMEEELVEFYRTMTRLVGRKPSAVIVERAAGGYGIIDRLEGTLPIIPVYPQGSKEERAGAVCYVVNKGIVQLPLAAPWLKDFVNEVENFPLASASDQVDAFVHSLAWELRKGSEFKMDQIICIPGAETIEQMSQRILEEHLAEIDYETPAFGISRIMPEFNPEDY